MHPNDMLFKRKLYIASTLLFLILNGCAGSVVNQARKKDIIALYKANERREITALIEQLGSSEANKRSSATNKLSNMGYKLSEIEVSLIVEIMRNGNKKWRVFLYRQSHCSWYEDISINYYAADILINLQSPYINQEIVKQAKVAKRRGKSGEYRITDPGWICY